MPSRRTNNFPWKWAWPRSSDASIFGSTVGYPSDSLASCCIQYTQWVLTCSRWRVVVMWLCHKTKWWCLKLVSSQDTSNIMILWRLYQSRAIAPTCLSRISNEIVDNNDRRYCSGTRQAALKGVDQRRRVIFEDWTPSRDWREGPYGQASHTRACWSVW